MTIGERIKKARLDKGYTQEQLAQMIGVAKSTLTGYEKGNREPDAMKINALAKALDVTGDYILDTGFSPGLTPEALAVARAYDKLSDYSKAIIDCVIAQEEKRRADSFGKTKHMRSTIKEVPTVEEMFGIKTAHDSDLQARYNSRKEVEELEAEIAMEKEENL